MKTLNLDQFQKEAPVQVVRSTLTLIDRRTGEVENREFYRFGIRFPIEAVGKELAQYGYDVIGYTPGEHVEGVLDFEVMFAGLNAIWALEANHD